MKSGIVLRGVLTFSLYNLASAATEVTLSPSAPFDLDTGAQFSTQAPNLKYDLVFGCGSGNEYLRALNGATWASSMTNNFALGLDTMKQATYAAPRNDFSGYPDLFHNARAQSAEQTGKVYYIQTPEGNLAKIRILRFKAMDPNPQVCRTLILEYELYPAQDGASRRRSKGAR